MIVSVQLVDDVDEMSDIAFNAIVKADLSSYKPPPFWF